jgi:hypothetical protein
MGDRFICIGRGSRAGDVAAAILDAVSARAGVSADLIEIRPVGQP